MMQTEQELNAQVQSLVSDKKFQTAADVIADWAYWDMIGRFEETPPPSVDPPKANRQDDRKAGGSMKGQLEDRLNEEFGENGWTA